MDVFHLGSVVLKGKLLISGGYGTKARVFISSELVSEHDSAYTKRLPRKLAQHCNIKINETTILITGGQSDNTWRSTFQNVETGRFWEGPIFKHGRPQ